jgi:Domain of unknown function (DUF4381)
MGAPDLPQHFGNYALGKDFVELSSPGAISWLPQTPGWWLVGAVLLAWALHAGWRRAVQWYRDRYRREAVRRLTLLEQQAQNPEWLLELNKLLKLTALAGYSRERVARLSGLQWVEFLNSQCPEPLFIAGLETCLARNIYGDNTLTEENKSALVAASQQWILQHRGDADA